MKEIFIKKKISIKYNFYEIHYKLFWLLLNVLRWRIILLNSIGATKQKVFNSVKYIYGSILILLCTYMDHPKMAHLYNPLFLSQSAWMLFAVIQSLAKCLWFQTFEQTWWGKYKSIQLLKLWVILEVILLLRILGYHSCWRCVWSYPHVSLLLLTFWLEIGDSFYTKYIFG